MKILFDGRLVTSKPSGVRDITLGLITGFKALESAGRLQLIVAGDKEDEAFDLVLPSLGYMHLGLPVTALRIGASRIVVPRQTVPLISPVPAVPVFMDIGFLRIPEMYSRHWVRDLTTKVAARSKNALAISEYTSRELAEEGLSRSVRPLPIQAIHRIAWSPDMSDRYLLCVAAQEPHKNLTRLVQAWHGADVGSWRLVICGRPGVASQELNETISSLGLQSSVQVVSGLDDDAYTRLLARCSAYIQPSFDEGLCIPALDLAAAGAPTSVSELGNLGYLYKAGGNASTFDPYSVPDITRCIERLLHDEQFREDASAWNLTNVSATDWTSVAEIAMDGMRR
ncbi:glycosyltransferase [Arthrobacter sp. KFRI-F3372]|uniref:glycosyltransferase n=1 Tax=Pseudarthrobacter oxydans TaxID=1671 RepID=UPI0027997660|nr:glycosyltransferase [Arthrobacter sp. KFRI-F3372]